MDILGVSKENIDVEMLLLISKEGINYFFDRLNKIDKEEHKDQYYYFKQYFNMYLFDSDVWDITLDEQFEILAKHKLDVSNIKQIENLIHEENITIFWNNLLIHLSLHKINTFIEITEIHKYIVNHPSWDFTNKPMNSLLVRKFSNNYGLTQCFYNIIIYLLKKKESYSFENYDFDSEDDSDNNNDSNKFKQCNSREIVINWIKRLCKKIHIDSKPIVSIDNVEEVLSFSEDDTYIKKELFIKETMTYFNITKVFLDIFDNGIKKENDINKINYSYIENQNDCKQHNLLTILFFSLQNLIEKTYFFKNEDLLKRYNYINYVEDEIEDLQNRYGDNLATPISKLKQILEFEKEICEFIENVITIKNINKIKDYYFVCSKYININYQIIKCNTINDTLSNMLMFILYEKIPPHSIIEEWYNFNQIYDVCLKIIKNNNLTSDPTHKIDVISLYSKTLINKLLPDNLFVIMSDIYKNNKKEIFEGIINTTLYIRDKLEDYNIVYKLDVFNQIMLIIKYCIEVGNQSIIENKEELKKFIGVLIEITNNSFEFMVKNLKVIKGLQDDGTFERLVYSEQNKIKNALLCACDYFKTSLTVLYSFCNTNINEYMSDEIINKFCNSLSFIMETLIGNKKNELAVKDIEGFYPLGDLILLSDILSVFIYNEKFIKVIGKNDTYDTPKLVSKFINILDKKNKITDIRKEQLTLFVGKIQGIMELEKSREDIEIPDEFCDPIMQTLIETPVLLPETNIFMERDVICRHLLSEESNPFNRDKLSIKTLDEFNALENIKAQVDEFKSKIDSWKKEINF